MIETFSAELPHGITLSCRACGPKQAPVLMFLHGFPEAAFAWDELMLQLSSEEAPGRSQASSLPPGDGLGKPRPGGNIAYRCIAPNLRGYERSSRPVEIEAYRAKHLMTDLVALLQHQGVTQLAALIAHDWGGALAWNLAAQRPELMQRLIIINAPHPGTFLRDLQHNPAQQAASAYMNFFCRADAQELLAENDFARLWPFFTKMNQGQPGSDWLTEPLRQQYREVWAMGLNGGLNYYRASPLRPPTAQDQGVMAIQFAPEFVTVKLPTHVIWGEADLALHASLLDGLEDFVPQLTLTRVPDASHWIVHERPQLVQAEIQRALHS
jgi:pimeloyl-ACP methyl ester carboxylesterase